MIKGIDHVAITVSDLKRSTEFYSKGLGLKEVMRWKSKIPGIKEIVFLKAENTMLELLAVEKPKAFKQEDVARAGVKHLCFEAKDIEKEIERMKKMGAKVLEDFHMLTEDHLVTVSGTMKADLKKGLKRAVFADPDGIPVELLQW